MAPYPIRRRRVRLLFPRMRPDADPRAAFEALLAECIERYSEEGPPALEEVLASHPESAGRLRARLGSLDDLHLLQAGGEAGRSQAFGPYQVLRTLGTGGMGVVYLAQDGRSGEQVALKACRFAFDGGERTRTRFEREVLAASRLAHPSIVRVRDWGECEGRPYYTMDYVAGATLADVVSELRKLALPLEELGPGHVARAVTRGLGPDAPALGTEVFGRTYVEIVCRFVLDVAQALVHAHEQGVVHRDVNPSNVLVGLDGRALVFDLGLARITNLPTLSRSGDFAGTPHYASPEQLAGSPGAIDARTDVYSLGATLYELLTLRRPFEGRSTPELADCIRHRDPSPPRRSNPELPRDLETICLTALQKDPRARYASMRALAEDVRRFASFQPIAARRVGWLKRSWRAAARRKARSVAIALTALVLVGSPLLLWWANDSIRAERDRADAAAREARQGAEDQAAVTEFLVEFFRLADPDARGESVPVSELLERGVARLATGYADRPLVRGALLEASARIHANLGLAHEALPLFDRALALRRSELGPRHPATARVLADLAGVHVAVGNGRDAEALALQALTVLDRTPGAELVAAQARRALGRALGARGERLQAEAELERALAAHLAAGAGDTEEAAALREDLARSARDDGRLALAAERFGEALATRRRALGADPRALPRTLREAAEVLRELGREAEASRCEAQARLLAARAPVPPEGRVERALGGLVPADFPVALLPPWQGEYEREFQAGITALQAGRPDDAVAHFARCALLDPGHPVPAYNAACGLALAGDLARAEGWLERAVELGLGLSDERFEGMRRDPDLARLHGRPAWAELVARSEAGRSAARDAQRAARPRAPAGPDAPRGVLVVLHGEGTRPAGPWTALADELGLALFAPPGPRPLGEAYREGRRWFEDMASFLRHPEATSAPLLEGLRARLLEAGLGGLPVVVAGEGQGALVAFDLLLRAPDLARGALLIEGPPHPRFTPEAARRTRMARARVLLVGEGAGVEGGLADWLVAAGLEADVVGDARAGLTALFAGP